MRILLLAIGACALGIIFLFEMLGWGSPGLGWGQKLLAVAGVVCFCSAFGPKSWVTAFGLLIGGSVLGLAGLELVLQLAAPGYLHTILKYSPRYRFVHTPSSEILTIHEKKDGGGIFRVTINELGMRGKEISVEPKPEVRISVYGDSFISADYSPTEATFVSQLEQELSAALTSQVQVLNFGVNGYGTDQVLLRISDELDTYRPKVVIVSLYGNDYGDLLRNQLFRLNGDGKLEYSPTPIHPQVVQKFSWARYLPKTVKLGLKSINLLIASSAPGDFSAPDRSAHAVRQKLELRKSEFTKFMSRVPVTFDDLFNDQPEMDMLAEPNSESSEYKSRLMKEIWRALLQECRKRKIELVAVVIPHVLEACDSCKFLEVSLPNLFPGFDRTGIVRVSRGILDELGIASVDLYPLMSSENRGDSNPLYISDGHWSDLGQQKAARLVSEVLLSRNFLPAPDRNR